LEIARGVSWLESVDTMLSKMVDRTAALRDGLKRKTGVVEKVAAIVKNRWENCAGFKVIELEENGNHFNIVRPPRKESDSEKRYNIDVTKKSCGCGEWQDHGVPCIHAIAYFRLHKKVLLEQILHEEVHQYYTYENEKMLLRRNINPVCMELLCYDGKTLPPRESTIRSTGRRRKKRIRTRSRWAYDPEKSNIVCSRCQQRGHNVRTCLTREALAGQGTDTNNIGELDLS
jgi:hypothetical protein